MTLLDRAGPATYPGQGPTDAAGVRGLLGATAAFVTVSAALVVVAAWHLTQGTTGIGADELVGVLIGSADDDVRDVLVDSRLPRMLAGLVVGVALGAAGALFQSLARNALASPDTLAVNAGAYFAVSLAAAFGLSLPFLGSGLVAFVGALVAAGAVLMLSGAGAASTTRLVLAGTAIALALDAAADSVLLLFEEETTGIFAWSNGTLTQTGLDGVRLAGPIVGAALLLGMLSSRRLDLMALGDDTAHVLGVPVRRTRVMVTVLAVLMCACAATLAGPIGFIGLAAPAAVRLLGKVVPTVARHAVLVPLAGLVGAVVVLLADALMRAFLGAEASLMVPTGVTTTILGAVVLVVLARNARDAGATRRPPVARVGGGRSRLRFLVVVGVLVVLTVGTAVVGLMSGYTQLLVGDLVNWARGDAVAVVEFAMDERTPRVVAALLGGAALALGGTVIQAVCRNPLAEPGFLGITAGAGLGAVIVVTATAATMPSISVAAGVGSVVAMALVYALTWRGGLDSDRLVLVGVGVAAGATAISALLLVRADPWNTPALFNWLSGSTYGRTWPQVLPALAALLIAMPLAWIAHRQLDLLAVDEDTPRLVGIRIERLRLLLLVAATLLSSTAVSAVGVVGFVGLVAPHAARALVGGRHLRVIPVAVLLGAVLLGLADTVGRTVIAPAQIPAGLIVAVVGAPYFLYLLRRSRA
jgi:ferric hydroxamate transport system permease protein